ncbi:MAG: hypothetical protein ACYDAD_05585, partial [Acidimicrobiales bacterium]
GRAPAALAVMDRSGVIDRGALSGSVVGNVEAALPDSDVVAVGLGRDAPAADASLGAIAEFVSRRADTLMLAFGVTPTTHEWRLTPVVAFGPGVHPGWLTSGSTRKLGLVTLTDVAPTVIGALGLVAPSGLVGQPLRIHADVAGPGSSPAPDRRLKTLVGLDRAAARRARSYLWILVPFIAAQALLYLVGLAWGSRRASRTGRDGRLGPPGAAMAWAGVSVAAFPLAALLVRAIFPAGLQTGAAAAAVVGADLSVLVALGGRRRRTPAVALAWVTGLTAGVLLVDILTGSHLEMGGILGYLPQSSARYYGIGNAALAVLTTTALLAAALHVQRAPRYGEAVLSAAGGLAVATIAVASPALGANAGGAVVLAPVGAVLVAAMIGRRRSGHRGPPRTGARVRRAALAGLVALASAVVAVVGTVALDLRRPPGQRTHLGEFGAGIERRGVDHALATAARRLSLDLRAIGASRWTVLVPVLALLVLYLVVWERRAGALLPFESALRAGAVAALVAGLLGTALEDSGSVVAAMVFVYLGPLMLVRAAEVGQDPVQGPATRMHLRGPPARVPSPAGYRFT